MSDDDMITLPSGRKFYAHCGLVGINLTGRGFEISEGYDGHIDMVRYNDEIHDYKLEWSKEEMMELADLVINRWISFREAVYQDKINVENLRQF